jgi:hypothetical protein
LSLLTAASASEAGAIRRSRTARERPVSRSTREDGLSGNVLLFRRGRLMMAVEFVQRGMAR